MGILDCYPLCDSLIEKAANATYQKHFLKKKPCNIYIDGLSVWFLAYTNNAPNRANAHQKLDDILCYIKSGDYFKVNSVIIYFNGEYPALKCKPVSEHVKSYEVRKWSNELLWNGTVDYVEFLDVGESESECFFQRNRGLASMIITSDSDIIPICYKYNRRTKNDTVFCYLIHREIFYDTSLLTTKLNKNAFTLLLMLRGNSNIIESLFSFSMVKIIFDLLKKDIPWYNQHFKQINSIMQEVSEDNIKKCIVYFIWIMTEAKEGSLGKFKWPPVCTVMKSDNYLEVLKWSILYSKFGKDIYGYDTNFKKSGNYECKFHFILRLCNNVFLDFEDDYDYQIDNFRDIEDAMKEIDSDRLFDL